jgi:hypothetical protein
MPDKDNPDNILIEPYADVFIKNTNGGGGNLTLAARSIEHDWTEKVDVSQMDLKPLVDLKKFNNFRYAEDDDDYIFQVFKAAQSGYSYGTLDWDAAVAASGLETIFQDEEEITADPFAATVIKYIMSQYSDLVVPMIYARSGDGSEEAFDNSPRILYNNGVKTLNYNYRVKDINGTTDIDEFLQFSHTDTVPSTTGTKDFQFWSDQIAIGQSPTDNLFTRYWQPYINELYHPDTRIMTLRVNLNASDIAAFKFTDTVMIKNRSFRVNKIEYKPNSLAKVEFILLP